MGDVTVLYKDTAPCTIAHLRHKIGDSAVCNAYDLTPSQLACSDHPFPELAVNATLTEQNDETANARTTEEVQRRESAINGGQTPKTGIVPYGVDGAIPSCVRHNDVIRGPIYPSDNLINATDMRQVGPVGQFDRQMAPDLRTESLRREALNADKDEAGFRRSLKASRLRRAKARFLAEQ